MFKILENVDEVEGGFGNADVVEILVALYFSATFYTFEFVVTGEYVSGADFGFDVPVLAEHPSVTVSYADTGIPALVSVVLKVFELRAHEMIGEAESAEVVFASEEVRSDEVTAESLAEPVTCLGLHEPVFPAA